ncbi:hypothetical protein [Kribbella amoyensis]|uniref:hypothetical protein n=1 Tax=Kribbella amoyensis TaxID=996641 RepID=UPI0011A4E2BB|nr:hypothetical protein [Kribbella amoyensis]
MRADTTATSVVATVSVAVAVLGHALAGGPVAWSVVPQLIALAGVCWLLGDLLADRREWAVIVLAGIQLYVHLALTATAHPAPAPMPTPMPASMPAGHSHHHDPSHVMPHGMPLPAAPPEPTLHDGVSGALTMTSAHLLVLLAGVVLIDRAHRWARRIVRILARLVPQLPAPVLQLVVVAREPSVVPAAPRLVRRWLTSNVSRRGPPGVRAVPVLS